VLQVVEIAQYKFIKNSDLGKSTPFALTHDPPPTFVFSYSGKDLSLLFLETDVRSSKPQPLPPTPLPVQQPLDTFQSADAIQHPAKQQHHQHSFSPINADRPHHPTLERDPMLRPDKRVDVCCCPTM
jgi:hypothetical protein